MSSKEPVASLTHKEIDIILAFQEKPLATFDEIARMTNLPKTTVFDIAKRLENLFFVNAVPNLQSLGLECVDVIVQADSGRKIEILEKLAFQHPYIAYFSRCFGAYSGMYLIFRIPCGHRDLVELLFQNLKINGVVDAFILLNFLNPPLLSTIQLNKWNFSNLTWDFQWKEWFNTLPQGQTQPKTLSRPLSPSVVKKGIQRIDLVILSELVINSRRSNSKIRESLELRKWAISSSTLSRRLKNIKDTCIQAYKVQINPQIFDLLNTVLIWGSGKPQVLETIKARFLASPIPFRSDLKIEQYRIYWYLHLTTFHLSELLFYLRSILDEIHFLFIDYPRAKIFSIDDEAFDEESRDWIVDEQFFIDNVLDKILD